ncbi:MAG: hypothetical protein A3C30_00350 [Candidatus Levybacteria bacterium RIFCSPHIGHO2_02_FULL_40_18]|nr:MAG: hypothetical protein A2869_04045 [Candidatus Levybacteria bacterium RIFCSPHIGHO2_01_FULL_40_58]OGH27154.1 MAG: hypothetical protein A3C30_00350 [Candidatus Levybacteria bacterium RIFCSPHIGHO2_02_FULL_40_18]OGH31013.1 MAG: hypothetical protein A3E43_04765 [Candidatus Levybacteria bacterium RIFCSPHIGHO2_12_FULL_40_31]OGH41024.1 MAG: hypothetical protein A2894_01980 [Candidatus Levybacteria bacterium RIFCSPLOWO2_01_FULL_40_64]OGH49454.1 MAG: hypothetical protein A3I54_02315 [Candidatus Lev
MAKENNRAESKHVKIIRGGGGPSGAVYGLGFIGALVYYIQHAASFWEGVLGVIKAILWPALLIYNLLEFFKI